MVYSLSQGLGILVEQRRTRLRRRGMALDSSLGVRGLGLRVQEFRARVLGDQMRKRLGFYGCSPNVLTNLDLRFLEMNTDPFTKAQ